LLKEFKNFSYIAFGRVISSAATAVFFLIFAAILEPEEYGLMGYLIALAATVSIVSRFGLPQSVVVYLAKGDELKANQVNFLAIITTSLASIGLIFINEFAGFLCWGLSFFFLYQHNLLGRKKYKGLLKNHILQISLVYVLPFPLYFIFDIPGIILGMAIGNIAVGIFILKSINLKQKSLQLLKNNYKVLLNNFGIDASTNMVRAIDRLLIAIVFGFGFTGIYVFIMQIFFGLEILPRVLYNFLLSEESSGKKHEKMIRMVVLSSGLLTILVIFGAPSIIEMFFSNYMEGVVSLQILSLSLVPSSISMIISAKLQAGESTKVGYSALVRIGSLLILIGILGTLYGLVGASVAVVVSTILNSAFLYFLYQNRIQK